MKVGDLFEGNCFILLRDLKPDLESIPTYGIWIKDGKKVVNRIGLDYDENTIFTTKSIGYLGGKMFPNNESVIIIGESPHSHDLESELE